MQQRLVYAVIQNRGGYSPDGDVWCMCHEIVVHYLKIFTSRSVFDRWVMDQCSSPNSHLSVVKWRQGRPPCEELQQIKAKYHDTWMQY